MNVYNITACFDDGSRISLGNGDVKFASTVKEVVFYGRHYAVCPKCGEELGGYFNDTLRKLKNCPYCGERICFTDG